MIFLSFNWRKSRFDPAFYIVSKKSCWFTLSSPQSSTTVVVSNENAPAAAPLVVKGYDVSGEVQSDSEPMKGVSFLLYSASVTQEVNGFIRFKSQSYMSFYNNDNVVTNVHRIIIYYLVNFS